MSVVDEASADRLLLWRRRPDAMVRDLFGVEPDLWQLDVLQAFPHNPRIAMVACKGPGKTCLLAWLAWNFLLTRDNPKLAGIANTGANLRDNLWTEMAVWQNKAPLLKSLFTWTAEKIFSKEFPETWWMSARTWSRNADRSEQANSLAGLHAVYIMVLMDESGDIPDSVGVAADAVLSSCKEGHIVQAGNPTALEGPLYRAAKVQRHLWWVKEISSDPMDPKRTPRVSIEWAQQQIDEYGRDHPWVMVNVLGKFPLSSLTTLLSEEDVMAAQKRHYDESHYGSFPKIIGVDVARQGLDESVLFKRQGMVAFVPARYRNLDSLEGAKKVAHLYQTWDADGVMMDVTGGYGYGWFDHLKIFGLDAIPVQFAGKPNKPNFLNKRAEMWWDMAQWVKKGGAVPPIAEMIRGLSAAQVFYKGDRMCLEEKDQIKERIGRSPDLEDALALTFAETVVRRPRDPFEILAQQRLHAVDYDPYDPSRV